MNGSKDFLHNLSILKRFTNIQYFVPPKSYKKETIKSCNFHPILKLGDKRKSKSRQPFESKTDALNAILSHNLRNKMKSNFNRFV